VTHPDCQRCTGYAEECREVEQTLARALKHPRGPFPEICPECQGGPCTVAACADEYLISVETPASMAESAAHEIERLRAQVTQLTTHLRQLLPHADPDHRADIRALLETR
jgi:hypothetical protein